MIARYVFDGVIDAKLVEELALGQHPAIEQDLVWMARRGELAGVVVKPPRYSATSIQWHADCERKFYWPTIAGLDSPPTESMRFGTKLHLHQERWLKHGTPQGDDVAGKLAALGAIMLPKPFTPGLQVEQPFELDPARTGLPVTITGTADFVIAPHDSEGRPDHSARHFVLGDHKTMKSRRYFHEKTKAWLSKNIQSNVYAYAKWIAMFEAGWRELRVVDKRWFYYFREDKQVELLKQPDTLEHVRECFETDVKPRVLAMAEMVSAAPRVTDVPANESACDAYGGCPHRARCFGFGQGSKVMGVLAGNFSKGAIAAKAAGTQPPPPKGAKTAPTAVNPPAPRPFTPKAAPPQDAVEDMEQEGEQQEQQQEEEAAPPPKAKKPKGATKKVAEVAAQTEKAFAPKGQALTTPGLNPGHEYWLFVGCAPAKGWTAPTTLIEEIIGAAQSRAGEGTHSGHYREGYGLLEAAFASWMEENALEGAIVLDPNSMVGRDLVSLLRSHASCVIERRA